MSQDNVLKKEFSKKDVQRVRNVMSGKADERTTGGVGYTKQQIHRKEGDIWEESGLHTYCPTMKFEEESDWNIKAATRYCTNNMIKMDAGMALERVLRSAKLEGRITYGVYQSVRKLGIIDPQRVMLCLHADDNADEDVALHIHFTLMEAFCRENGIRLIKVDCHESLAKLLGDNHPTAVDNNPGPPAPRANTEDFVCLLVDFPKELDDNDCCFLEFYNSLALKMPFPRISVAA